MKDYKVNLRNLRASLTLAVGKETTEKERNNAGTVGSMCGLPMVTRVAISLEFPWRHLPQMLCVFTWTSHIRTSNIDRGPSSNNY